jgi:hypothetical protein
MFADQQTAPNLTGRLCSEEVDRLTEAAQLKNPQQRRADVRYPFSVKVVLRSDQSSHFSKQSVSRNLDFGQLVSRRCSDDWTDIDASGWQFFGYMAGTR